MTKIFKVMVQDETRQSNLIMDVKGFSHFSLAYDLYFAGVHMIVRDAYIKQSNKALLQREIKEKLGPAYWASLNYPEYL